MIRTVIVNKMTKFGTIDGVWTENDELMNLFVLHSRQGTAKIIVDTSETLMYKFVQQDNPLSPTATEFCEYSSLFNK
ncbi:MAG: hypothetical protein EKK55_17995 [Rhodocyclaceae bacterium]|nr:MAG: hypothetical protein EKK55_17995 [Rhodocyclaceae bacterium]